MASEQQDNQPQGKAYIIAGPKQLAERCVRPGDAQSAAVLAIAAAERAIEELSVNFDDWMASEVGRLTSAHRAAQSDRLDGRALEEMFDIAHDLKGQACTLGYPLAGDVCDSLCKLLEACPDVRRLPAVLVDQHVNAVKAMLHEGATGASHPTAGKLSSRLRAVTEDFIARETARQAAT